MVETEPFLRRMPSYLLMLSLLLLAVANAQSLPRVQLDATSYEVGETVTLRGSGLAPDEEYVLTVDGPSDVTEETIAADASGEIVYTVELDEAGEWTLRLSGDGVSSALTLEAEEPIAEGEQPAEPATDPDAEPSPDTGTEPAADMGAEPETEDERQQPAADTGGEAGTEDESEQAAAPQETGEQEESSQEDAGLPSATAQERQETVEEEEEEEQAAPVTVTVEGDAIVGSRDDSQVWRFDFPEDSGGTGALLETGEGVWVGHGNSVLLLDRRTGVAQARHPMPGRVIRLEPSGDSISVVSDVDGRLRQRIEVDEEGPMSTVRFGVDTAVFDWLRNEAGVEDPEARLEADPTNPWLHLNAGLAAGNGEGRGHLEEAVERGRTFYDLAGIARELFEAGEAELAQSAMDRALQDFADRGYDPQLLTSTELHRAYNFPLTSMQEALDEGDLDDAGFWAPWLYRLASEEAPETRAALLEYSRQLSAVGQRDAAALWRERATEDRTSSPAASLDRFFLGLGRSGWYAVAALLAAILALHLTLTAKYWAPQSLQMRRVRETGGSARPWARLFAIRYYSFTEKLVLVLLFASTLVLLGLTRWYDTAGERPLPLASGTLSSPVARDVVTSSPLEGQRGAFIEGYAAQVAGEEGTARDEYVVAGDYPPALNNLAALEDDDVLYQRALELAPGMPEAAYNLGRGPNPSPFHASYRSDEPLLAVPGTADFRTAVSGNWQQAVGTTFENPWRALRDMEFFGVPPLVWQILLALFLLWILVTVIWLFIPRPSLARNAPRTGLYHLLALLIPGSGLADEAWGVLLMVPWALLGVDALAQWLGWERSLGLSLETELWALAAIYVVNLIAFIVEFVSYRRRMKELHRRHPEAAEAYGIRGT